MSGSQNFYTRHFARWGYQWWSVRAGDYHYNLAWGHDGQKIVLLDEFDMVFVTKADPFSAQHGDDPWKNEKTNLNLTADFIASLPNECWQTGVSIGWLATRCP